MKKINIASLVIAFIIFILYVLDYNFVSTRILWSLTIYGFGWIDDMDLIYKIIMWLRDNFLFMVLIISSLGYLITFGLLSVIRFIIKVIISLFK